MSVKYQAYDEYKDSGVEWVGQYPAGWGLTRVKFESYVKARVGWHGLKSDDFTDEGAYLVTGSDFKGPVIKWEDCYHCDFDRYEQDPYIQLKEGDLLITKDGTIGKVALVSDLNGKATLNSGVFVVRSLADNYTSKFYFWLLQASVFTGFVDFNKTGSTIVHLYQDTFVNFRYAMPSLNEQQIIANFLDHETAKIDTLIEKQQQLIKLLKEKRQAVISHAVTKGLNPNAPMRDSGVEWLGEVPEHWEVSRIYLLFSESSVRASTEVELDYPVLSVSIHHGISDKELNSEELDRKVQRSENKSLYKVIHENYLAYNMMRAWQGGFGASTLSGLVSPAYVVCKPRTLLNSFYFELVLRTLNAVTELKRYSRGITDFRLRLYWDEFRNICVPVPPSDEIDVILKSLSKTNSTYDNLIVVVERQVELLQERRTALISAVVTGKIDVRNCPIKNIRKIDVKENIRGS